MASTTVLAKTVVVADDTAFVRDRFRAALEHAGHRVIIVGRGAELLRLVKAGANALDLLVLDLRLQDSRGVELIRTIRRLDGGRLAILVFSATIASADEVRELAALGVAGYVNEYCAAAHIMPALSPHLFPDSFNRRGGPRVALGAAIQYRVENAIAGAITINLSRGGVAIRTTGPLEVGTRALLKFRLPGTTRDVEAAGVVVWSDRHLGMGMQFEDVDPTAQAAIDGFVDSHFFSNRKA